MRVREEMEVRENGGRRKGWIGWVKAGKDLCIREDESG